VFSWHKKYPADWIKNSASCGDRQEKSTLISDRGRIARHIIPLLGRKSVTSVTRNDVEDFMHDVAAGKTAGREKTKPHGLSIVRGGRGVAGRTVALLGAIFTYAVRQGHRIDNPIHGVVKFAVGRRQRRLTDDEYRMLGIALSKAGQERVWKPAIAATWLMVLTGWRRGEVLGLYPEASEFRTQGWGGWEPSGRVAPHEGTAAEGLSSHGQRDQADD
jgi:hypothetical protein